MRVLITGGAGFIGSHLADAYVGRGDEVFIIPGYPAPQAIAAQIHSKSTYGRLVARVTQGGESPAAAIKWAEGELEGYSRS